MSVVGPAVDDLTEIWQLRHGREAPWRQTSRSIRAQGDPLTRANLAIDGSDLLALGVTGPAVGHILSALLERVLDNPRLNTREALLALAKEIS
jgi:tRNA nucleotidyltransferase (CCA-adding enzyme)